MELVPRWDKDLPRHTWAVESGCAQAALLAAQATFTAEAEAALEELEAGVGDALTTYMEVPCWGPLCRKGAKKQTRHRSLFLSSELAVASSALTVWPVAACPHVQAFLAKLEQLVLCAQGTLSLPQRLKVASLIAQDLHARDAVQRLVDKRATTSLDFSWTAHLKYYWAPDAKEVHRRV